MTRADPVLTAYRRKEEYGMDREIGFRVWTKELGMRYPDGNAAQNSEGIKLRIVFDESGIAILIGRPGAEKWESPKDFELMEYTGLHDKNGRKIYEGDIVEWYFCAVPADRTKKLAVVLNHSFDNIAYEYKLYSEPYPDLTKSFPILSGGDKFEVVGNLYDNPGLLAR